MSEGDFRLIRQAGVVIPPRLAARKVAGYAIVEQTVTEEGATADPRVVESNYSIFNRAALDAVQDYEFMPRVEGGIPVPLPAFVPEWSLSRHTRTCERLAKRSERQDSGSFACGGIRVTTLVADTEAAGHSSRDILGASR